MTKYLEGTNLGFQSEFEVLKVRVTPAPIDQIISFIASTLESGHNGWIATVNPEFIVSARKDSQFLRVLNSADLAVVDGVGVQIALFLLYHIRSPRTPGADIIRDICALAANKGWPVFFLGAAPGVAEAAARALRAEISELQVAGTYAGRPIPEEDEHIRQMIKNSGARLLFVAFGMRNQEIWIHRNLPYLGSIVAMGVGGTFDYLSGKVPRAPGLIRKLGLEWFYRLLRQPWRWKRQIALPIFIYLILKELLLFKSNIKKKG